MWQPNKLSELDFVLADKWKKIANSLEIEIISPFEIASDEITYQYVVLIKHFGMKEATNGYLPMNISQYAIDNLNENEAKNFFLNYFEWFGSDDLKPKWHIWRDLE